MYELRYTPNFKVVLQTGDFVLIEDIGPWTEVPTITNQPEVVCEILISSGNVQQYQRLFYIDADRMFGEMKFDIEHGYSNFDLPASKDKVADVALSAWKMVQKHTKKGG